MRSISFFSSTSSVNEDNEGGFTLIEVLVALAVLAIMGGLMTSFLTQLRTVNRFEAEISKQTQLDAAATYMRRLLSTVRPVVILDSDTDKNPFLEGEGTSLRAAVVTRQGVYSLGLRDVHVFLEQRNGQTNLVHTLVPRRVEDGVPVVPENDPIPIIDDIDSIKFEYSTGQNWSGVFNSDGALPKAIRITLSAKIDKRTLIASAISQSN